MSKVNFITFRKIFLRSFFGITYALLSLIKYAIVFGVETTFNKSFQRYVEPAAVVLRLFEYPLVIPFLSKLYLIFRLDLLYFSYFFALINKCIGV